MTEEAINGDIYVGDVGVDIIAYCGLKADMSTALVREIWIQAPGTNTWNKKTARMWEGDAEHTDAEALKHYIAYKTTEATELATSGSYIVQSYGEWGDTSKHHGTANTLLVKELGE